ncbi:MAG: hypothetical protein Q4Q58_02230 [Thermoplasmata archaeon]|nr:hypothetical protein [Thermoplasmata archaeon]
MRKTIIIAALAVSLAVLLAAVPSADAADVSTETVYTNGETLEMSGAYDFSEGGRLVFESGAELSISGTATLTASGTTILVLRAGSVVSFGNTPSTVSADTEISLDGTLVMTSNLTEGDTVSVTISIDLSEGGTLTSTGGAESSMTGGSGVELSIGVTADETSISYALTAEVPRMTGNRTGYSVEATGVSADISIKMDLDAGTITVGGVDGGEGSISFDSLRISSSEGTLDVAGTEIDALIYTADGTSWSVSAEAKTLTVSVSNGDDGWTVGLDDAVVYSSIGRGGSISRLTALSAEFSASSFTASVVTDGTTTDISAMTVSGSLAVDGSAGTLTADVTAESMGLGQKTSSDSWGVAIEGASLGASVNTDSGDGTIIIKAETSEVDPPASLNDRMILDIEEFTLTGAAFTVTMADGSASGTSITAESVEGTLADNMGTVSGTGLSRTSDGTSFSTLGVDTSTTYTYIQRSVMSASGVTVSDNTYTMDSMRVEITDGDGNISVISGTGVTTDMSHISGDVTYTDISYYAAMYVGILVLDGGTHSFSDSYVRAVYALNGATVSGTVRLTNGGFVSYGDDNELSVAYSSAGIVATLSLSSTGVQSGTIGLRDGYSAIPAWTEGTEYTLVSDTEATLVGLTGTITVTATPTTYTVTAGDNTYQVALGETVTIPAPAEIEGYVFYGWSDGGAVSDEWKYTLETAGDKTLTAVYTREADGWSYQNGVIVLDSMAGNGLYMTDDAYSMMTRLASQYSTTVLTVNTEVGSMTAPDIGELSSGDYFLMYAEERDGTTVYRVSGPNWSDITVSIVVSASNADVDSVGVQMANQYGKVYDVETTSVVDNGDGTMTVSFRMLDDSTDTAAYYVTYDSGGSDSTMLYGAVVVVIVVIVAAAAVLIHRRSA